MTTTRYDLRTIQGRHDYLAALAALAVDAGELTVEHRVWRGDRAARLYTADYWISVDDDGDLVGGGQCSRTDLARWVALEDLIEAKFDVGPLATRPARPRRRSGCRECHGPVQSWSGGAHCGLCHDCA